MIMTMENLDYWVIFFFKFIEVSVAGKQNDLISEFDLY